MLAANLLLALVWAAAMGRLDAATLAVGFVLGYAALALMAPFRPDARYHRRVAVALLFALRYGVEMVRSGVRVAHDVLTPRSRARPGLVRVPLDARTDAEITAVANLISLTPGTLTVDVAPDRRSLLVHAMFLGDREAELDALVRSLKETVERPLLETIR